MTNQVLECGDIKKMSLCHSFLKFIKLSSEIFAFSEVLYFSTKNAIKLPYKKVA
jgi:hypothetical protein